MIVGVVGMEEEMEEKKMVELVVELEGRGGAWPAKGSTMVVIRWLLETKKKKEKEMKEKERKGGGYIRENNYIIMLPFPSY